MLYSFLPQGVCPREIQIDISDDGNTVNRVMFVGGCKGNTQGIEHLVEGMPVNKVIAKLSDIHCGSKPTSCPDQLAKALRAAQKDVRRHCHPDNAIDLEK